MTAESRIAAVASGQLALECGSATNNTERQKQVGFSPTMFVSGTKLLMQKGSSIKSFRDLAGRKVALTAGTTNEKTMRELAAKLRIEMALVVAADHATSYGLLSIGQVDAFALDDALLYGRLAQNKSFGDFIVTGDFLSYDSYDPYGIMFRKGDAALARLVNDTFHQLAEDREIERRYTRCFLRKLPSGVSLDLPMSPQLEAVVQTMVSRTE